MKNILYLTVAILMVFSISSCQDAAAIQAREALKAKANIPFVPVETPMGLGVINKLSASEFQQAITDKKGKLVDVRTPEEFAEGHIESALNIDFKKKTFPSYISTMAKDEPILIYCRSGNRSGKAALIMQALGFKEITELAPGFKGWNAEKLPVVTTDNDANIALQEKLKTDAPNPVALSTLGEAKDVDLENFEHTINAENITLLDVRTPEEFATGHIEGATNIDWKSRHFTENILAVTNDRPVAIYCRSGNRSSRAKLAMQAIGFSNIINLDTGFKSWVAANKPVKTLEVKGDIRHLDVTNFNNAILGNVGVLVDVRTPKEYAEAHITGAINVDYNNANFKMEAAKLDKEKPVLIYCRSGKRSGRAMAILEGMGFKVYNLNHGFLDWKSNAMPIEGKNIKAKDTGEEGC